LKFARLGDAKMAQRMRPPDLWLPHKSHTVRGYESVAWDFRPLERGEPAKPLSVASLESDMHLDPAVDGAGFDDKAIVDEVARGIGDDVEDEWGTLLCAPHGSALKFMKVAEEKINKSVTKKWASNHLLPCWPLRATPYGVVDETKPGGDPKHRLTNDLSWPLPGMLPKGGGEFVESHNAAMDRQGWPEARLLRVSEYAESVAILRSSGAAVAVWSVDCEAYYRAIGRRPSQLWRNAVAVEDGFQLDKRCCFGSAADAAKCSRVSNFITFHVRRALQEVDERYPTRDPAILRWLERRKAAAEEAGAPFDSKWSSLHAIGMYVDDGLGASMNDALFDREGAALMRGGVHVRRTTLHFEAMRETLLRFGHKSSKGKEQPPGMRLVALGVEIDVEYGVMKLDRKKAESYSKAVKESRDAPWIEKRSLQRLLGRLQFVAMCHPISRQWLHALYRALRARYRRWDGKVLLSGAAQEELSKWSHALQAVADGTAEMKVPLASPASFPAFKSEGSGAIYADASGEFGFGAWTRCGKEILYVAGTWDQEEKEELIIADKELYASTVGLVVLAKAARFTSVYSFTDNTVAMAAMRNLTPSSPPSQALTVARIDWMTAHGVREAAERITSKSNLWADLISRKGGERIFVAQAEALGFSVKRLSIPKEWRDTAWLRSSVESA
jgi:hypothetical protein